MEQQRINVCIKLVTDERIRFLVPIFPKDVEVYMDWELIGMPTLVHSNKDILSTNDIQ